MTVPTIIPSISFPAVGNAVLDNNLKPLIVGVDSKSLCIEPKTIEKILMSKSKVAAVFLTNYGGFNPYIEKIASICKKNQIPCFEKNFTVDDVKSADEAFVTGTFAGVIPVNSFDHEIMGNGTRGPMVEKLQKLYVEMIKEVCHVK